MRIFTDRNDGDAVLSVSLRLVRMMVSLRWTFTMMLRVYGRLFKFEYSERVTIPSDPKATQKATQKRPETDQQKQEDAILKLIKENHYIRRKEMVSRLDIHESSVKRRLASLQEKGMIIKVVIGRFRTDHFNLLVSL